MAKKRIVNTKQQNTTGIEELSFAVFELLLSFPLFPPRFPPPEDMFTFLCSEALRLVDSMGF